MFDVIFTFLLSKNLLGFFLILLFMLCVFDADLFFYSAVIPFMLSFLKRGVANICYVVHENC